MVRNTRKPPPLLGLEECSREVVLLEVRSLGHPEEARAMIGLAW